MDVGCVGCWNLIVLQTLPNGWIMSRHEVWPKWIG